jgi:uncharacterized protein YcbX
VAARVTRLWRHPIKAHGAESVGETVLAAGRTMPWDRIWAVAHAAARPNRDGDGWLPCANFSRGAKSPELMAIRARVDEEAGSVTLTHPRLAPITVNPDIPEDAARLIAWVQPISNPDRARPVSVVRGGRGMTDSDWASISILNAASLRVLGERAGRILAQERFRGNVWVEGPEPWEEFAWVGRRLRIGGAVLAVREPIARCKATAVDPETGRIDTDTLGALRSGWQHQDFGVFAEVVEGGRIAVGDGVEVA